MDLQREGVWLSKAAAEFADQDLVHAMKSAASAFKALRPDPPEAFRRHPELLEELTATERLAWNHWRDCQDRVDIDFLVHRLMHGVLFAFGDKEFAGNGAEWIPVRAWAAFDFDRNDKNAIVRSDGLRYRFVKVVPASIALTSVTPSSTVPRSSRRRPPSRTDYTADDRPLVKEMHRMLTAEPAEAKDVQDAARRMEAKAKGNGTSDSKVKRLMKKYSAMFSG